MNNQTDKGGYTPKRINLQEFKDNFCTTLCKDEADGKTYIKIPIHDYETLGIFKYYIAKAIGYVAECKEEKHNRENKDTAYTIQYLAHILENIDIGSELEGISRLISQD